VARPAELRRPFLLEEDKCGFRPEWIEHQGADGAEVINYTLGHIFAAPPPRFDLYIQHMPRLTIQDTVLGVLWNADKNFSP
jgi:hypothetical protein